ncbi:MAG: branched-chain amino acid ABC transporter permease [Chloroflexi bacterium]|nr:branched-chain amino acid ABC transporter permease [Chloroflexota bacterium]
MATHQNSLEWRASVREIRNRLKVLTERYPIIANVLIIVLSALLGYFIPYLAAEPIFRTEFNNPEQNFILMLARAGWYSMFALGYALVFSILGLLNLAHGAVYMAGAFAGLWITANQDLPIEYALPAGMLAGGLIGILVDWVAFLPLRARNAPRTSQLISSIGASIFLVNLAFILFIDQFNAPVNRFPAEKVNSIRAFQGTVPIERIEVFGLTLIDQLDYTVFPMQVTMFVVAIVMLIFLQFVIAHSKIGKAMRVVAYNPKVAQLLGINVSLIFAVTFFLSGAFAGAAGVLQGMFRVVGPFMGSEVGLIGLTVIVLGGMRSIPGAVVGSFIIANLQIATIAMGYSWLEEAVVFLALFLMLLIRPQGILGEPLQDRA